MPFRKLNARTVPGVQLQRTGQHFILSGCLKKCRAIFRLGQQPVSMIDTDLCTGINTILSLPKFYQPSPVTVIKIDRKGIEYHLETGRHKVVQPCVAGSFLPCVNG